MKNRILVTGSNGFVGSFVVQKLLDEGLTVFATSFSQDQSSFKGCTGYNFIQADLTDAFQVHDLFAIAKPNVVVHCAAMSKPDVCEVNQAAAYQVNVEATLHVLLNAHEHHSFLLLLSTDFIFDGERGMYDEKHIPNPVNYYGKTKLEAEQIVQEYEGDWAIVRTVLVYGQPIFGRDNFISLIIKKLKNKEAYKVVNDQVRTPTYVKDLAEAIYEIVYQHKIGIYHISGKDILTPYEMAITVAKVMNINDHLLEPVTHDTFEEIAKRPLRTGLDIKKAEIEIGYNPRSFKEAINIILDNNIES